MKEKFQSLGIILTKEKARKVVGGCSSASICYDAYFSAYPGCVSTMETFQQTGVIMNGDCYDGIRTSFMICWDQMCNEQQY